MATIQSGEAVQNSGVTDSWTADVTTASKAEQVRLLYALSRNSIVVNLAGAILVGAWLWNSIAGGPLLAWLAAMGGYLCLSFGLYLGFQRSEARDPRLWERAFAAKVALGGLVWGSLIWLLLPGASAFERLFVVLTLCTISLGATGVLCVSRLAFLAFMVPIVALAAIPLLFIGPDGLSAAGWGVLIFVAMLFSLHDHLYRSLRLTFAKRFESEALAMEQAVIFDSAAEAIGLLRPHYLVKCNRQWADLFGCSVEEAIGKPAWVWWPNYENWSAFARQCMPVLGQGKVYRAVVQLRRFNGELFSAEISGMSIDPANLDLGIVWMGTDISQRLRIESELRVSEQRFRDLVALSTDWYWEIDAAFRLTRVSGTAVDQSGHGDEQVLGKRRWEIPFIRGVDEDQWRAHRDTLEAHLPFRDFAYQMVRADGEMRWFSISGNPAYDECGDFAGYHGAGTDITERVRAAERYRHLAHHDTLTGLPNRRLLADRLDLALALARRTGNRVSLLLLDLDDFKSINDSLGHSAGDGVLNVIAQRLRGTVRETDTVARLGGDEFVLLLPEVAQDGDPARVAAKVLDAFAAPVAAGRREFTLGASIGIAVFPLHATDAESLLQQADIAMYDAKRAGGRCYRLAGQRNPAETPAAPGVPTAGT